MKDIILGLGNPILKDDGIGIYVAARLKAERPDLNVREVSASGIDLIEQILDFRKAIIIDSIITGKQPLGYVQVFQSEDFKKETPSHIHSIDLISALEIAKQYDLKIPEETFFLGIEVKDNASFEERFSLEIDALKDVIYYQVKDKVLKILEG